MINVGLIGVGYIGPIHLEALARIPGINVRAVCDVNRDQAEKIAEKYDVPSVYDDYRDVLADADIDVVHNCTPNKYHSAITREAIERGKHVLSEKPLAMTSEEAGELVDLAAEKGIVHGVDFCYRYYPVVQEMAVRIRNGELGDVRMVTGSYLQDWLSTINDYSWRLEKSEGGASNVAADLGSHWFDLIQFATGLRVTEVMADFKALIPVRKRPKKQALAFDSSDTAEVEDVKVELDDYAAVLFKLSNGATGSFTTSQVCAGRKSDTEFQVYGSNCSYAWNHKHCTEFWIGHRERANEIFIENPMLQNESTARYASLPAGHPLGYHDAVLNLFNDFYDVVKTGKESTAVSRPTFQTGYDEMKILAAMVESNKSGTWATVK